MCTKWCKVFYKHLLYWIVLCVFIHTVYGKTDKKYYKYTKSKHGDLVFKHNFEANLFSQPITKIKKVSTPAQPPPPVFFQKNNLPKTKTSLLKKKLSTLYFHVDMGKLLSNNHIKGIPYGNIAVGDLQKQYGYSVNIQWGYNQPNQLLNLSASFHKQLYTIIPVIFGKIHTTFTQNHSNVLLTPGIAIIYKYFRISGQYGGIQLTKNTLNAYKYLQTGVYMLPLEGFEIGINYYYDRIIHASHYGTRVTLYPLEFFHVHNLIILPLSFRSIQSKNTFDTQITIGLGMAIRGNSSQSIPHVLMNNTFNIYENNNEIKRKTEK